MADQDDGQDHAENGRGEVCLSVYKVEQALPGATAGSAKLNMPTCSRLVVTLGATSGSWSLAVQPMGGGASNRSRAWSVARVGGWSSHPKRVRWRAENPIDLCGT